MLLPYVSHERKPVRQRVIDFVDQAVLAEHFGFGAYGIGERHDGLAVSSSPAVILANAAARTSMS